MVKDEKYLIDLIHYLVKFPKETEWLEFKTNYYQADEIGKYVSALSNSATLYEKNSGYMIWGIDDDTHDIVGTTFDYETKKVGNEEFQNWLHRLLKPKINFEFYKVKVDGKDIIVLEIPKAENVVTKFKNEAYIRVGTSKKSLNETPLKEKALWKILNATSFEDGIAIENISEDTVLEKLDTEAYFTLLDIPIPDEKEGIFHYLQQDKLILKEDTGNWSITNLGAILLAKNLDVPVIVTCQLSRKCEKRDNKRPTMSDFSDSKYGIYTYSDEVLFIYRDSYYNKENKNDIAEIIGEKNKKGNTGIVKLKWIPEYLKFSEDI